MNTEHTENNDPPETIGSRLRKAREASGLTQKTVADRLYLKLSTIQEIEENKLQPVSSTFERGYIRSYAKLLHLPEEGLLPKLNEKTEGKIIKLSKKPYFLSNKKHKKWDRCLMLFTWLILFTVLGLTGTWWWQNNKIQQAEINSMAAKSSEKLLTQNSLIKKDGSTSHIEVPSPYPFILIEKNHVPVTQGNHKKVIYPVLSGHP